MEIFGVWHDINDGYANVRNDIATWMFRLLILVIVLGAKEKVCNKALFDEGVY
jgi:hypothetical protein